MIVFGRVRETPTLPFQSPSGGLNSFTESSRHARECVYWNQTLSSSIVSFDVLCVDEVHSCIDRVDGIGVDIRILLSVDLDSSWSK